MYDVIAAMIAPAQANAGTRCRVCAHRITENDDFGRSERVCRRCRRR